jgi:periplasmic protein CpxP/Spy
MNTVPRSSHQASRVLAQASPATRRAWTTLLATSALALGLALAPAAQAEGGRHGSPGMAHGHAHGMGGHGMAMGMGMLGHPRMAERVLDRINATPEQRTQVRALIKGAQDESRAEREAGRALSQQAAALFAQPTVDANAAEALRQQMLVRADAASRRMTQLMLDLSRVLTPEQRAQLAAERQQRREKMERHRAERAERGERASPR